MGVVRGGLRQFGGDPVDVIVGAGAVPTRHIVHDPEGSPRGGFLDGPRDGAEQGPAVGGIIRYQIGQPGLRSQD